MSKAVLLSIQPRWCEKIASGRKTIEVRKTRPNLETPFKCYIYCTSCKSFYSVGSLRYGDDELYRIPNGKIKYGTSVELMAYGDDKYGPENFLNRKVIGEFVCDRIYELAPLNHAPDDVEQQACLTREEIVRYLKGVGCGWRISDLKIYDKPKDLSEFKSWVKPFTWDFPEPITRPPQSWCYVEELT